MQVTVNFYKRLREDSDLLKRLSALKAKYEDTYWIGWKAGFGAASLSFHEAMTLATLIAHAVLKSDAAAYIDNMRLQVQPDQPEIR